ncbi:hypothetical protein ASPZODRAFT_136756 [Penicilliopsis zonata CBS 506.65]|uniref:5-Methylcytosine G/T mismatch-specific DNA glycosylase n=1 Tax=Penicilliopsis zonata CBS 506.65 TaxID=1073090 RepID=A0A1L9S6X1_9EURO|nr:hypothetical protein ASPZODRAFT_136756 [Penicilliopsis zonata CBS 506.65]OJJ42900.1 hypothetical protein ASPZODRAFT_136756 [Penicilliopsis zonata CBS 506.65]
MFPVRPNERDRDRDRARKSTSSLVSSGTKGKTKAKDRDRTIDHNRSARSSATRDHGRGSTVSTATATVTAPSTASTTTSTISTTTCQRRSSMPGIDTASRPMSASSFLESRTSLPYPSFSKAHSKEAVGKPGIPTPDPTDLTDAHPEEKRQANGNHNNQTEHHNAPPSPPLTGVDQPEEGRRSPPRPAASTTEEKPKQPAKTKFRIRTESTRSSSSLRTKKENNTTATNNTAKASPSQPDTPTKIRLQQTERDAAPSRTTSHKTSKSTALKDEVRLPKRSASHATMSSPSRSSLPLRDAAVESVANDSSDATSIAPNQNPTYQKPMTPPQKPPSRTQNRSSTSHRSSRGGGGGGGSAAVSPAAVSFSDAAASRSPATNSGFGAPPPPPPPPALPGSIPRVDYLLRNGGLPDRVPKSLLAAARPDAPLFQPNVLAAHVFEPFHRLLSDYNNVMSGNGSLAVATGYRSVARRLLDRLEAVFARDISCEACDCLMCAHEDPENRESGVSWGEVLELVSGRRLLPSWPPFSLAPFMLDPVSSAEEHIPMQKLDIDVPEEYREHYIRQSRKTKLAVDQWLAEQTEQTTSPPDEVDDETLTFAMMTHLSADERALFCALLGISNTTTKSPAPKSELPPTPRHRPAPLLSAAGGIQRLYRLPTQPRDPETAIFMLNNPSIHHVLATLAAISDDEWEILVSGRFDGFLRSGAEDDVPSRWNTRSAPGVPTRGSTPSPMDSGVGGWGPRPASQPHGDHASASFGGPIALDEENEIAALAEIEREIFAGMEALEDAFEALHNKAEVVRLALRERGAGLSVANQRRRGSTMEARLGTPASAPWESGPEDDGIDDDRSLAPDDSASNISSNRRRRPKRRTERRTPAPVEEEDEEEEEGSHGGRRDRDHRRSLRR